MTDAYQATTTRLVDVDAPRPRMDWRGVAAALVVLAFVAVLNFARTPPTTVNLLAVSGLVAAAALGAGRLVQLLRVHWAWGVVLGPVLAVIGIVVLLLGAVLFFMAKASLG